MVISGYGSLSRRLLQSKLPYRFVHRTRNSSTSVSSIFISLLDHRRHADGGLTTASLIIRYALGREWGTSPRAAHLGYQTAS